MEQVFLSYIPHGINAKHFFRCTSEEDLNGVTELHKQLFPEGGVEFVVLYNNRNIRRKMTGDVILAYRQFLLGLPEQERSRCRLVLHTQPVDDNGTDIPALIRDCANEIKAVFSPERIETKTLNYLYNLSDVVINLASNEGFGLATAEALMAERLIIVNVTGGLQDQCGFVDENGIYLHESLHFNAQWGSNHDGRYKQHGEWVLPCFPVQRALIGSPPTPYIFDDRCSWEDAGEKIREVYNMSQEEKIRRGRLGREYVLTQGFSSEEMCKRFIEGFEAVMQQWLPRQKYMVLKSE
jgi:hypothetical protein